MFKYLGWLYPSVIRRVGFNLCNTASSIQGKFLLQATQKGKSRILGGLQQSPSLPETPETDNGLSDI